MNDEQFDDLKQFIAATVSQSEASLHDEMGNGFATLRKEMNQLEERLTKRMDDGFAGAAEPIDQINNRLGELDQRLTRLEHQTA